MTATERAHALAEQLLERHGVLTREALRVRGRHGRLQRGLPRAEGAGGGRPGPPRLRRRRARSGPVRRSWGDRPPSRRTGIRPRPGRRDAPPDGAWSSRRPTRPSPTARRWRGRRPRAARPRPPARSSCSSTAPRRPLLERGGRSLVTFGGARRRARRGCPRCSDWSTGGRLRKLEIAQVDGVPVHDAGVGRHLTEAGFDGRVPGLDATAALPPACDRARSAERTTRVGWTGLGCSQPTP